MVGGAAHAEQEDVPQAGQDGLAQDAWVATRRDGVGQRRQRGSGVGCGNGVEQGVEGLALLDDPAGGRHLVEGRERVAGGAGAGADHVVDDVGGEAQVGVVDHPGHVLGELLHRQQVEVEVLGAAANGGQHLLRVGRGQHEHHVARRLLERLQQRGRRRGREHVDLVEDVDLRPARRTQRDPADELADGVHPVVGGGVELLHVVGGAGVDGQAAVAGAVGLTVGQVLAVERLGEDPGGGGLAGSAGPAEQIGVTDALVADGVAERPDHVLLAPDVAEPAGSVAAVERLIGHRRSPYRSPPARSPRFGPAHDVRASPRRSGQPTTGRDPRAGRDGSGGIGGLS